MLQNEQGAVSNQRSLYVTYVLIAINVLVFILMVMDGAGVLEPNGLVAIKWGSDYAPLTLSGDWWRLLTCTFIHFGVLHLVMNMYALFMIGIYLEPMLGKVKYIAAYLCTGVLSSLVSVWWHTEPLNSAGASGAIFGMYGLFLALLSTKIIPADTRKSLLQSIGIFVVYNLIYGMKSGVDNAAHIGGLLSGAVIGYLYYFSIRKEQEGQRLSWLVPAIVLATCISVFTYLQNNVAPAEGRNDILSELKGLGYKDSGKFNDDLTRFSSLETKAIDVITDTSLTETALKQKISEIAFPAWNSAESLLEKMDQMNIADISHKKVTLLSKYVSLRKEELNVINEYIDKKEDSLLTKRDQIDEKISSLINELKNLQ